MDVFDLDGKRVETIAAAKLSPERLQSQKYLVYLASGLFTLRISSEGNRGSRNIREH